MGLFEANDGFVNIAAFGGQMWQRFCDALNATALLSILTIKALRAEHAIVTRSNGI